MMTGGRRQDNVMLTPSSSPTSTVAARTHAAGAFLELATQPPRYDKALVPPYRAKFDGPEGPELTVL